MRGAGAGKVRVKTAKGRTAQSVRWLERHLNDPYVKKAKAEGWRSRAAFKLIELDEKFHFVKGSRAVVDLGVAPGGWAQVVRKMAPKAAVVGIDLLPTDPRPSSPSKICARAAPSSPRSLPAARTRSCWRC